MRPTPPPSLLERPWCARLVVWLRDQACQSIRSGRQRCRSIRSDSGRRCRRCCRHGSTRRTTSGRANKDHAEIFPYHRIPGGGRFRRAKNPSQAIGDLMPNLEQINQLAPFRASETPGRSRLRTTTAPCWRPRRARADWHLLHKTFIYSGLIDAARCLILWCRLNKLLVRENAGDLSIPRDSGFSQRDRSGAGVHRSHRRFYLHARRSGDQYRLLFRRRRDLQQSERRTGLARTD